LIDHHYHKQTDYGSITSEYCKATTQVLSATL